MLGSGMKIRSIRGDMEMEKKEPKIKIYVSCHKESYIPENKLLYPIQVGTAIAEKKLEGMLYDNEGDNISAKNKQYCELTSQYWVWKNDREADYYRFFHYRRYFNFGLREIEEDGWGNVEYTEPINKKILEELKIEEEWMKRIICQYDIIVPKRRKLPIEQKNVFEQYITSIGQKKEDLKTVIDILIKKFPEYFDICQEYLASDEVYECNMFIMKKDMFIEYTEWLFNILFELEKERDFSAYNEVELRAPAYLGERLFAIWFLYNSKKRKWKVLELQKTLFRDTNKEKKFIETKPEAVTVILSGNDYYSPYIAVMLESILENSNYKRKYDIYILTRDISEENKNRIHAIVKNKDNFSLSFVDVFHFVREKSFFVDQHISVETYYRLYILDLFKSTSKVLYLDSDMVVNEDIAYLYDTNIEGCYLAAVKDIDIAGSRKKDKAISEYISEEVGCKKDGSYFQAGVILFNLDFIRKKYKTEDLVKLALQKEWHYWDQDVLNYAFKEKVYYIPQSWNVLMNWKNETSDSRLNSIRCAPYVLYSEYMEARKDPKIVHYAGYQKPWEVTECDMSEYFWKYARKTPYYEMIINHTKVKETIVVEKLEQKSNQDVLVREIDNQGIKIKGVDDTIYVDGVMVKLINSFNKRYPIGSKKRARLRKIIKRFVK